MSVPPVQVVAAFAGVATIRPDGKLSVKSRLSAARELALLSMVKVRVLIPPKTIVSGVNTLLKVGIGSMMRSAVAGAATDKP